jgi:dTMP kinase
LAYQGYGHGQPLAPLRSLIAYATGGLIPHATVYLDLAVEKGLARKRTGAGDAWNRMEEKALAYHEAVRRGYLEMAAESPRWLVVDASQGIEAVHAEVLAQVLNL